jgi:phosphoserine phosphatase
MTSRGHDLVREPKKRRRIIVFDVEGVLIPKKRYLFFELGRTRGLPHFLTMIFYGFLYETGLISLRFALKRVFKAFKGIPEQELVQIFRELPLMPGAEKTVKRLRNDGWKIALISSGLPSIVVKDLAAKLKADYAFGFELSVDNGILTGGIWGDVIERGGKLPLLVEILENEGLSAEECVIVADDRNNMPMFLPEALKIGYNPDFAVRIKADYVVTGELLEILPAVKGKAKQREGKLDNSEIIREAMHMIGFTMPLFASLFGLQPVALFIVLVTALFTISELARMERRNLPLISALTRHAATEPELYEFATAPIFYALGILLTLVFFNPPASSAAIAAFALGDSTASLFGKALGKETLPFNKGKTLEGSLVGFSLAFAAAMFFISPWKALVGAATAMIVESLPLPLSDNLVTPLATALVLSLIP